MSRNGGAGKMTGGFIALFRLTVAFPAFGMVSGQFSPED
jgi:hypothetical protein